ncbi:aconitate hydratase AcnA [Saccharolobus solfataricus]|uniref:Aconitate hydratase n=3 Tax=Saccharolobus solfataricus TaxID=2287 RepID=Q97Z42_SACS2|nr:aconitate hydratase AcnA [Saccharolobus solfataricus]AAK41354.1 Aconitate hydratase [Saccharolobus solfataricus P2]AKA74296.1 aconitate hydratase AcnA [Saccharolobus solfataricus]AKA76992.1 aconitate hydratase AcnA [Saccharolobus solfataricus]AKA79684.1 aconitate hydratase AcnA [Saccharolobus solfataricus]AZF68779.1 aconitate hydratase AcnA [Saccharolobus solfataricus]
MPNKFSYKGSEIYYYPLKELEEKGYKISDLPYSIRILIENVYRNLDGSKITEEDLENITKWKIGEELAFMPTRVVMQDYTGVPLLVDLAAMREKMIQLKRDPKMINPVVPADLVIDHSVQVDYYGTVYSLEFNMKKEFERNLERYQFLKWAQGAFRNLRIVPPGKGIIHQVNLEYLSTVVAKAEVKGLLTAFPEVIIGTDSHTTMIEGLGILGWGVGGLEAEAVLLGEPYYLNVPEVIGVRLTGEIQEGVTPTDVVLYITELLRKKNVVSKFVEFFGPSLSLLSVPDRATIANMAPEYGATAAYFPIDDVTVSYLELTNRDGEFVKKYAQLQELFYDDSRKIRYSDIVEVDLSKIEPAIAGPRNPDERISLREVKGKLSKEKKKKGKYVEDNAVVLAAITSCTNTSNPTVMLGAGILAKKAVEMGLRVPPYIKTSTAPGSPVVAEYLKETGLLPYLEALGFHLVGFGCTTCIGNAGPLPKYVEEDIKENGIETYAVISGNRNFEGRINPLLKGTFLASPILVVAYALAGRIDIDFYNEPIGFDPNGKPVYLRDIWPSLKEIKAYVNMALKPELYKRNSNIFEGNELWNSLKTPQGDIYSWDEKSTYIRLPPWYSEEKQEELDDITNARILLLLGDKITTDHISPAGPITPDSPAGLYLKQFGVSDLNTYGARRGNHEVMLRGGFFNPKMKNLLVEKEGGYTVHFPDRKIASVYEVAMQYKKEGVPLVIVAGKQYGSGSSRDWAAKVTKLLGVKAVLAESFERIHRSNLVAMGVIPIQIPDWRDLGIKGDETVNIKGIKDLKPKKELTIEFVKSNGEKITTKGVARIDNNVELMYVKKGGILNYVLEKFLENERKS